MKKNYKTLMVLLVMSLFALNTNAQIIYHDLNPDGQPSSLDFNQDGTNEFDITTQIKLGDYIEYNNVSIGSENNIHAVGVYDNGNGDSWDVPHFVAQGFTIDATNNWEGQGDAYPNGDWSASGTNPTIIPGTDQYMAVRFNLTPNLAEGDPVYYGWVRVNIDADGNVTYKDYAYNSVAGQSITAGQMPAAASVNQSLLSNTITVFPSPANNVVNVKSNLQSGTMVLTNLLGKKVKELKITKGNNLMDVSTLDTGIYIITLFDGGKLIGNKKIVIN